MVIFCSFLNWIEHLYSALSGKGLRGIRAINHNYGDKLIIFVVN